MVVVPPAPAVGEGADPAKTATYGVGSLFRYIGLLLESFQVSLFIPLVFILGFNFFVSVNISAFIEA